MAVLMDAGRRDQLEEAVGELVSGEPEQLDARVLGPMAAWDFVRPSCGDDRMARRLPTA